MRHRPAVCIKCWKYVEAMAYGQSQAWPEWTEEDYEQHKDEVERHFGDHFAEVERGMVQELSAQPGGRS